MLLCSCCANSSHALLVDDLAWFSCLVLFRVYGQVIWCSLLLVLVLSSVMSSRLFLVYSEIGTFGSQVPICVCIFKDCFVQMCLVSFSVS